MTYEWTQKNAVLDAHQYSLGRYGGLPGMRDEGALEAALARPINKNAYGEDDIAVLAAAYAFGIAKSHPFNDGNKRAALMVTLQFLDDNGHPLKANPVELTEAVLKLASSDITEQEFAAFIRQHIK